MNTQVMFKSAFKGKDWDLPLFPVISLACWFSAGNEKPNDPREKPSPASLKGSPCRFIPNIQTLGHSLPTNPSHPFWWVPLSCITDLFGSTQIPSRLSETEHRLQLRLRGIPKGALREHHALDAARHQRRACRMAGWREGWDFSLVGCPGGRKLQEKHPGRKTVMLQIPDIAAGKREGPVKTTFGTQSALKQQLQWTQTNRGKDSKCPQTQHPRPRPKKKEKELGLEKPCGQTKSPIGSRRVDAAWVGVPEAT